MDLHDEIAKVAFDLFERDGRKHGKDQEHWLEAERIVRTRHEQARASKAPKKTPAEPKKATVEPKKATSKSLVTKKEALPRATSAEKGAKKAPAKKPAR